MENLLPDNELLQSIAEVLNKQSAQTFTSPGIGVGLGGTILFNSHYAAYTKDESYYTLAGDLLVQAYKAIDPQTYKASFSTNFYRDISEFGCLLDYLADHGHLDIDNQAMMDKIDTILHRRLVYHIQNGNFGIADGAIGIGFYFIKQKNSRLAPECLLLLLNAIRDTRQGNREQGYYWICNYFHEPRIYTGLSHGSAMMINFLATLHQTGFHQEECAELIEYASRYLVNNKLDEGGLILFPLWIGQKDVTPNHCLIYGDLGTAYAISAGARALNHGTYLKEGTAIALKTTKRIADEETLIKDASIFYGAAAPYLIYENLYQQTGLTDFNTAADHWLGQIPAMANKRNGYAGFNSYFYNDQPAVQLSFNFGIAGIGLTMLQALSKGEYKINEFTWMPELLNQNA